MSEILLINPPIYYKEGIPQILDVSYPPLGILYLAAVLEKEKIKTDIIDIGAVNQSLNETISYIKKIKPKIVGITAMTPLLQGTVSLAKAIKNEFKDKIKVGLGGSHISADPEFIDRIKYFDFGIQGEAELTFLDLIKKILNNKKVKGIYKGEIYKDLDKIPWPARDKINLTKYLKRASLLATRGCPFHCYYCSRPAVSDFVRVRDPKDIVDEMEWLYPHCGGDYLFQDDSLTIRKEHTLKLCDEMLSRKKKFRWGAYTRIDLVDEDLLKKMGESGCYSLTFGIETGNNKLRSELIGKKFNNDQIKKVIGLCNKYKIYADGFFMLGHPGETIKQIEETKKFILNNNFNIVGVSIATPFPGSKLWDYAVKEGIIDKSYIDNFAIGKSGSGYAGVYPVYHPRNISLESLYDYRKEIMRKFYLSPKYIFRRIVKDVKSPSNLIIDIKEGINVLWKGSSARSPYKMEKNENNQKN